MTSDMLCQSDNTFVLVKIYTWSLINDLMTTCDMLCQPNSNFVLVKIVRMSAFLCYCYCNSKYEIVICKIIYFR